MTRCLIFVVSVLLALQGCAWATLTRTTFDNQLPAELEAKTIYDEHGEGVTLVRPRIDGRDLGWFFLDTGASHLIIDDALARSLELPRLFRASVTDCDLPATLRRARSFSLGRLTLHNPVVVGVDLSVLLERVGELTNAEIVGIVGYPVFAKAVVEIDYARDEGDDRVALYDPADYELGEGHWRALRVVNKRPVHAATIEDAAETPFMLDTGKAGRLSLYSGFIEAHSLLETRVVTREPNTTACGEVEELQGVLDHMTFAGKRFDGPTVRFKLPGSVNDETDGRLAGTIGRGVLREFTVILNYPEAKIALNPKPAPASRFGGPGGAGME